MEPNQQILSYFENNLSKGYTIDQLKETCISQGYAEQDVNEIIKQLNSKSKNKTSKYLSFNLFIVPTIIIIILLLTLSFFKIGEQIIKLFLILSIIITFILLFRTFWTKKEVTSKFFLISSSIYILILNPLLLSLTQVGSYFMTALYTLKSSIELFPMEIFEFIVITSYSLFILYAFIASLFLSRNVYFILQEKQKNKTSTFILSLLCFCFVVFIIFGISFSIKYISDRLLLNLLGNLV